MFAKAPAPAGSSGPPGPVATAAAVPDWLRAWLVGGAAACAAVTFTNPFELGGAKKKPEYSSSFRAARNIFKNEGLRGLQRGLAPAYGYQLLMNGIAAVCLFPSRHPACLSAFALELGLYDQLKSLLHRALHPRDHAEIPVAHSLTVAAGLCSGVCGALVASPLFLVKTRLQSQTPAANLAVGFQHKYTGSLNALASIYRTQGFRGLYHGVDASAFRTGLGSAVQLSSYDGIKRAVVRTGHFDEPSPVVHWLSSLLTGFIVAVAMTPADVVATRSYNQPHDPATGRGLYYANPIDCFIKTVRAEGFPALYKGFWVRAHHTHLSPSVGHRGRPANRFRFAPFLLFTFADCRR
ncbi:MAG: mitochondrial carrier domain-containing protein [Olpidium bornovanus]|uniref:Mitochondrial carrier domain-containing protein n=1 Tax=Olpidium bornovanus TaxID=278681 RepID=A0A8H8DK13_9FUNG|nr:MAG: mitochondrial carrier domain-containing protein [Olpidium bornovanus]